MHGSFYVFPMKGSVRRICKNIFKKVSKKNRNFRLKIGYNSACNIKYTWLLKVKYLLNGCMDLYEIWNLSSSSILVEFNFLNFCCWKAHLQNDKFHQKILLSSQGIKDQLNARFSCNPFIIYHSSIFTWLIVEQELFYRRFSWNIHNVEDSNCIFHIVEDITIYLSILWKLSILLLHKSFHFNCC